MGGGGRQDGEGGGTERQTRAGGEGAGVGGWCGGREERPGPLGPKEFEGGVGERGQRWGAGRGRGAEPGGGGQGAGAGRGGPGGALEALVGAARFWLFRTADWLLSRTRASPAPRSSR